MDEVPVVSPVILPPPSIVATPVAVLAHVPPLNPSTSVLVAPKHMPVAPVIVVGCGFTVTPDVV